MVPFSVYLHNSLNEVFSNSLFIGIILALIVSDLRSSKYFQWHNKTKKPFLKFLLFLLPYVVILPTALILLVCVISLFWLISLFGV